VSSDVQSNSALYCPVCGVELQRQQDAFLCRACARAWPTRDGIASFRETDVYGGDDPRPEFRALLEDIRQRGWDEAVHHRLPRANRERYRDIFDPRLADWFYVIDIGARGRALDLGSEWGGLSMRLAKLFDDVVAVDSVWERIEFARMLFEHEGLGNVTQVHAGIGELPLARESFDLIVIGDWFEWAALWGDERDPAVAQRSVLTKLHSLLRAGGTLCLTVRNRCALSAMLGRIRRRTGQGGLRHSAAGYRRLLTAAGFAEVEGLAAFPSHSHPRMLVPLADPSRLAWATELSLARRARKLSGPARLAHLVSRRRAVARLACSLSESFVFAARRPGWEGARACPAAPAPGATSLPRQLRERITDEWADLGLGGPRPSSISVVQFSGNWERGGKVNWFAFIERAESPALVAKIARAPAEAERVSNEHEALAWLCSLDASVGRHVPRPLARWDIDGHLVSLQQSVPGRPLTGQLGRESADAAVVRALRMCLPFLTDLALQTRRDLPRGAGHPCLSALIDRALSEATSPRYPERTRELLRGLAGLAQEGQETRCAPFTVTHHGDMSAGDLLADGNGFRVIDWEWSVREGLPFADLVCVGISVASMSGSHTIAATMQALTADDAQGAPFETVSELGRAYCASLGLSEGARRPLAAAALLNLMLRMPNSRLSVLQLTLPSDDVPPIAAAGALLGMRAR